MKLFLLSVIFAAFAFAQEAPAPTPNAPTTETSAVSAEPPTTVIVVPGVAPQAPDIPQVVTPELIRIRALVKKWKLEFKMEDWQVDVALVSPEYLFFSTGVPALAASQWDLPTKTGHIYVLGEDEYSKGLKNRTHIKNIRRDQENSIVHEYLHNFWEHMQNEEAAVSWLANHIVKE